MYFRCLVVQVFSLFFIFLQTPTYGERAQKLAVLYSYPPGEWYYGIQETLEKTSRDLGMEIRFEPIVFHAEFWARRPREEFAQEQARIVSLIRGLAPSAVVVCDDEAADAFATAIHGLGLPQFFLGINRPLTEIGWWPQVRANAAIVLEQYPVEHLLLNARRLVPAARRISVVTSLNPTSQIILTTLRDQVAKANARFGSEPFVLADIFQSEKWQDWKTHLQGVRKKADLVWILIPYDVRDFHGVEVPIERIGNWLGAHLELPSLGLSSIHPKMGVLLTVAMTPQQLARATISQIHCWISGTPFAQIAPILEKRGHLQINLPAARKLRLKIPNAILSASTLIHESKVPYGR